MATEVTRRCENCWFATQDDGIYAWIDCNAPVPDSVSNVRLRMGPDDGKECPAWALKTKQTT